MPRTRPTDVYGAPVVQPVATTAPGPGQSPARHHGHRGGGVVLAIAASLLIAVALAGAMLDTSASDPVDEAHAILALRLFERQAAASEQLNQRIDVYAPPGPGDAARTAETAAAEIRALVVEARGVLLVSPGADYGTDPAHDGFVAALEELAFTARASALLAAVHDAVFAGTGSVPLGEAQQYVTNVAALVPSGSPLGRWATALLGAIDGHDRHGEAESARAETQGVWATQVGALAPPALPKLRTVVAHVPRPVLESLRGDVTLGSALQRLEAIPAEAGA